MTRFTLAIILSCWLMTAVTLAFADPAGAAVGVCMIAGVSTAAGIGMLAWGWMRTCR